MSDSCETDILSETRVLYPAALFVLSVNIQIIWVSQFSRIKSKFLVSAMRKKDQKYV